MTHPASAAAVAGDRSFFGHPRGLSTLFFTEMWERFSYYGMRAHLILFMTDAPAAGGLGFDASTAGAIYGLYVSMVYMTTLPGGWIADRLIGAQRAVVVGGVLIASGHFSMAIPTLTTFYLGLMLIVLGTGLLKGNVSVIVGRLYATDDARRDAGYSIFYMGINLGAFLAPLVCGYLGQRVNWHIGFAAAGVGMVLGLVQFMYGRKYLGDAGRHPADAGSREATARQRAQAVRWLSVVTTLLVVMGVGLGLGVIPLTPTQLADAAGVGLLGLVLLFFGWLFLSPGWTARERKQLVVVSALFLGASIFWSEFEQAGSTLNLFAARYTSNEVFGISFPSSYYQSLNGLFIILFAPVFAWIWLRLGARGTEPSSPAKFGLGLVLVGAGFAILSGGATLAMSGVLVSPLWLIVAYFLHTCGELCLSPVGLSAMSKLAPARIGGLIMGVWFLGGSVGNYIAGRVTGLYVSLTPPTLLGVVALVGLVAGALFLACARPMARLEGKV
jgi:POT family proton-dependent oligopeptide transporter